MSVSKEVLNQAFNYMIMIEATNIAENKLLSNVRINNRQLVKDGLKSMERATNNLFKYGDFSDSEVDVLRRTRQHLAKSYDILDGYVVRENRGYDSMKKALNAVSSNISTQIVHKEEQTSTEQFSAQTSQELDKVFMMHRGLFEMCFKAITELDEHENYSFQMELMELYGRYFNNKRKQNDD